MADIYWCILCSSDTHSSTYAVNIETQLTKRQTHFQKFGVLLLLVCKVMTTLPRGDTVSIYIYRERERERISICIFMHILKSPFMHIKKSPFMHIMKSPFMHIMLVNVMCSIYNLMHCYVGVVFIFRV